MLWLLLGAFVVAHGIVTAAVWVLPAGKDAPFDAADSWLFGDVRAMSLVLGILAGLGFVATGVGMSGHFAWWPRSAVGAGVVGAILMVLWFNPWLSLGLAITVAVLVAGFRALDTS